MRRWRRATRAQRRILGPVYLSGGITIALVATLFAVGSFSGTVQNFLGVIAFISFGMVPLFFLAGLLRTRLYRAAARLLREVPDDPTPGEIQSGLRRVLGDPTLVFLTWVDEVGSYVDTEGNRCRLTPVAPKRAVTEIAYENIKLGAIVHDEALHHQQALVDEVVSAARIAMMKDRGLQALQLSEARSRALLDAIPDLMFRMARDGTYLEAAGPARVADPPARGADRPQRRRAAAARRRRPVRGGARAAGLGRRADDRVSPGHRRRGSRLRGAHRARGRTTR